MSRARSIWLVAVLAIALGGCVETTPDYASPDCVGGEDTLVLMAQSVPSASLVPCLDALPTGWTIASTDIRSGGAHTVYADASGGPYTVEMNFTATCDIGDAVEVPSDEDGATRFEDIEDVEVGYHGTRYYMFDGGCVRYRFELNGEGWSGVVNDSATATTFTTRDALTAYVRKSSNGVIESL